MTLRDIMRAPGMRYALVALVLGIGAAAWAAMRAYEVEAAETPATPVTLSSAGLKPPPPVVRVDVRDVVAGDIFSPERKAPAKRYLLAGEEEAAGPTAPTGPREPPRPTLLGTALHVDSTLSFATLQLGGGRPTNVRIGGKIGDYTVIAIERRRVVLLTPTGNAVDIFTR